MMEKYDKGGEENYEKKKITRVENNKSEARIETENYQKSLMANVLVQVCRGLVIIL